MPRPLAPSRSELKKALLIAFQLNELERLITDIDPTLHSRVDWRGSMAQVVDNLTALADRTGLTRELLWFAWLERPTSTLADLMEFGGMLHGFLSSPMLLHGARRGTSLAAAALREALVQRAQ